MLVAFFLVSAFVIIHFFSKYISLPEHLVRRFVSFSAGVGVAYIFVHLWPQVAVTQSEAMETFDWLNEHVLQYALYLIALSGLIISYTLDRLIARAHAKDEKENPDKLDSALFKSQMGFFAVYNAMIGYLVVQYANTNTNIYIFFIAFALHFFTNDWGLRHHHEGIYDKYGRWLLSGSIIVGYVIALVTDFPDYFIGSVESFITGAMTLNIIKHELPSERNGNLEGFLIGVISAAVLFTLL